MSWGVNIKNVFVYRTTIEEAPQKLQESEDITRLWRDQLLLLCSPNSENYHLICEAIQGIKEEAVRTHLLRLIVSAQPDEVEES